MGNDTSNIRAHRGATRALAVLFWIGVWQVASMAVGSEFILAGPLDAARALVRLVPSPAFWEHIGFSSLRIIGGTVASYILALVLAALAWRSAVARILISPALTAIKSTPVACVVVVLLIWFGSMNVSAIAVFLMALPGVYFSVLKGLDELDPKLAELFDVHRARPAVRLCALIWPGVLPYLVAASETVLSMSWKAGVAAELIGVPDGSIGERIYQAKLLLETADLFAWTIVVVAIAWVFERAALALMRASWPASGRWAAQRTATESMAPAVPTALHASGLVVGYRDRAACAAVDFDLAGGDSLCLMGPSGAGKTTILRTVCGLTPALGGTLTVPDGARRAVVFQEARLVDDLTAVENVSLFAAADADVHGLLSELLPEDAREIPVRELSGGQRRRVELARAFAAPADIVLLDEPFSGLDRATHDDALAFIARHRGERILIVSTHDEGDAAALAAPILRIG